MTANMRKLPVGGFVAFTAVRFMAVEHGREYITQRTNPQPLLADTGNLEDMCDYRSHVQRLLKSILDILSFIYICDDFVNVV